MSPAHIAEKASDLAEEINDVAAALRVLIVRLDLLRENGSTTPPPRLRDRLYDLMRRWRGWQTMRTTSPQTLPHSHPGRCP